MDRPKKSKVFFFSNDIQPNLRNIKKIKAFIEKIFEYEKRQLESINYIFCTDSFLLKINNKYLKHNFFTDIITFDLSERPGFIKADVFISIDRVRDNAIRLKTSFKSELHRVIFHGALHLCGYRDKKGNEAKKMREKEDIYLLKYFK